MNKLKPELSKKNRYWISRHRYYELKHFCLQYKEWKTKYLSLSDPYHVTIRFDERTNSDVEWSDSTADMVIKRDRYLSKMKLIEETAYQADEALGNYILKGVTEGLGYTYLRSVMDIPCGKEMYYNKYRRFFWLLDSKIDS